MKAAVYGGTRNVYRNMLAPMKSLLMNSDVDKIYFLIEDDEFPYPLPKEVECINVSNQPWFTSDCINWYDVWGGYMVLIRSMYTKIFPHLDKILALDNDTIVNKDISGLWDIDLGDNYIAGVRDTEKLNKHGLYVNVGSLMYNLKKIREDKKDEEGLQILNYIRLEMPEQDLFNSIFRGKILELPSKYNSCPRFMNFDPIDRAIYHYAGDRKYVNYPLVRYYDNVSYKKIYTHKKIMRKKNDRPDNSLLQ